MLVDDKITVVIMKKRAVEGKDVMIDDVTDIRSFYDRNVENEQGRLERHPVERDVTWRFLDKYLPPSGKILEVGAATGAYPIPLAKKGYSVTAVFTESDREV
jgi:2-polyprenyl-3-methyl-5-hydroxy-6-metoxy-1,4-benzoquinol methylase